MSQSAHRDRIKSSIKDPVSFFGLDTKIILTFKGEDARAARKWIYETLRPFRALFAGFTGPRDPIVMTLYSGSGYMVQDWIEIFLPKQEYQDLEIEMFYYSASNPDHTGRLKFGVQKPFGQLKLY